MAKYFNYFPKTLYSANNSSRGLDAVTNIISRFGFEESLKQNSAAFYKYDIQEGDTPEIIASKYYENSEKHWVVLMFNDIYDPQFDWPLQSRTLIEYINNKYSAPEYADTANTSVTGLSWAMNVNNIHSYYKVVTKTNQDDLQFIEKLQIDADTYANTAATTNTYTLQDNGVIKVEVTKETLSYFDFEEAENEKKRTIKLLKPEFIPQVEKEFKKVIKG
jgi:hypothetical protein